MNALILCEGFSDFTLLQYYMSRAYRWIDKGSASGTLLYKSNKQGHSRRLYRGEDTVTISSTGGVSQMQEAFEKAIIRNAAQEPGGEVFDKIIIVTDHDNEDTPEQWKIILEESFSRRNVSFRLLQGNDYDCKQLNDMGDTLQFQVFTLIIPSTHTGALETFLLDSIKDQEPYDGMIIEKGHTFIETVDPQKKYLKHRGQKIKAEFDVYFSVRTSSEQFEMRRDIIKGVPWENFDDVQKEFKILGEL